MEVSTRTWDVEPGQAGRAMSRAIAMARGASARTGRPVSAWIDVYAAPPTTVTFAAASADGLSMLDDGEAHGVFTGGGVEVVGERIATAGVPGRSPLFAEVVVACSVNGAVADTLGWAVETSTGITRRTELRTVVVRTTTDDGAATIRRVTLANSLRVLDDAAEFVADDLSALECLGATVRRLFVRRLR